MSEWGWLDKIINEETDRVEDFFFSDELDEDKEIKTVKRGRPKDTPRQKAMRQLSKAKKHVEEAMKRLEIFRAARKK